MLFQKTKIFLMLASLSIPLLGQEADADSSAQPAEDDDFGTEFIIDRPEEAVEEPDSLEADVPDVKDETLVLKGGDEIEKKYSKKISYLSLLFPGTGEYLIGKKKLGKSLMVSDGLLWIGLGTAFFLRALIKDDLRAYLYTYGDCDGKKSVAGRSAWDLTDSELELPLYADSSAFYEERIFKPSRDDLMKKIDFYWQWDSEETHQEYYDLWKKGNQAKVTGYYFLGVALIVRVVSFINTGRMIKKAGMSGFEKKKTAFFVKPGIFQMDTPGLVISYSF
jgi:hypothetical protein